VYREQAYRARAWVTELTIAGLVIYRYGLLPSLLSVIVAVCHRWCEEAGYAPWCEQGVHNGENSVSHDAQL